jgi:alcohol dehydrogenase (NADP+)
MVHSGTAFTLNTGAKIPAIGFGTWQDKEAQEPAVTIALKSGYRHIDTAHIYGTEEAVGRAIKNSGVPRGEIFITTKLWNNAHHPDDVEGQLDDSLKALGVDHVDLWLMHWPSPFARGNALMPKDKNDNIKTGDTDYVETYRAMERVLKTGKTKAIGVSNFSKAELERLLQETSVVPAAHQVELHRTLQGSEELVLT